MSGDTSSGDNSSGVYFFWQNFIRWKQHSSALRLWVRCLKKHVERLVTRKGEKKVLKLHLLALLASYFIYTYGLENYNKFLFARRIYMVQAYRQVILGFPQHNCLGCIAAFILLVIVYKLLLDYRNIFHHIFHTKIITVSIFFSYINYMCMFFINLQRSINRVLKFLYDKVHKWKRC